MRAALAAQAQHLRTGGLAVQTAVVAGDPAEAILALSTREGVDLIVLGTHGRSNWDHFLLGSVALKVVRHATLPVLLVRESATPRRQPHVRKRFWGVRRRPPSRADQRGSA